MSKEMFIAAHDELIDEYLEEHPEASHGLASAVTAEAAYRLMTDRLADMANELRQRRKEGL